MFIMSKYKLMFSLLFLTVSGLAWGQLPIESIELSDTYIFPCKKATPIDLFKAHNVNLYVSPENGYWGDIDGVPYNGKKRADINIKERPCTNGNIFVPPTLVGDTGTYRFYFYFTSAKGYCDISNKTRIILDLYLGAVNCLDPTEGELRDAYMFCHADYTERNSQYLYDKPLTMEALLFSGLTLDEDILKWKKGHNRLNPWDDIEVYPDSVSLRLRSQFRKLGNGSFILNLVDSVTDKLIDTTFWVIINQDEGPKFTDVRIIVFPQPQMHLNYSPDILYEVSKEYDMDDQITIEVINDGLYEFRKIEYYLNRKDLNKLYLGGDTTRNEITLSALDFSAVEDIIEVIATDEQGCIVKQEDNVIVNVPFPSIFTPDGDGINDVFLGGEKFRNREFHLEVTQRWGPRIYYGESGWDGTYRGNLTPPGTYLYVLTLKLADGSTRTVKGTVVLMRQGR
jgi:gliding motility-associated-like protein